MFQMAQTKSRGFDSSIRLHRRPLNARKVTASRSMEKETKTTNSAAESLDNPFERLFKQLPNYESSEYMTLLDNAPVEQLPAQVLVRAYRDLLARGLNELANLTLERLLDPQQKYGYLTIVRHLARGRNPQNQQWSDEEDLFQAALMEILKVLPTARGALAENAWVRFCQNSFTDAWRNFHGRRGERLKADFVQPTKDDESGEYRFFVEETTGENAPWHNGIKPSELPRVEALIAKTIATIQDPFIKAVAEDQFGPKPSPISSARDQNAKQIPLTEKLQASRFQISRALRSAKSRLASQLMADNELELQRDWLKDFLR